MSSKKQTNQKTKTSYNPSFEEKLLAEQWRAIHQAFAKMRDRSGFE